MTENPPVPEDIADKIWDVVERHCGADTRPDVAHGKRSFVRYALEGTWTEYRFCGNLGFGGKLWLNAGRIYVACYSEDSTPRRKAAIAAANMELNEILLEWIARVDNEKEQGGVPDSTD